MSSREVLESFYGTSIVWFEDPRDEKARERFELIAAYASRLLDSRLEELVKGRETVSALDVAGGTGIAGAAFAKALASRGLHVRLTVVDARKAFSNACLGSERNSSLNLLRIHSILLLSLLAFPSASRLILLLASTCLSLVESTAALTYAPKILLVRADYLFCI